MSAAATCPTCGLEVAPDTPFCPRDGTEILDVVARDATVKRDPLAGAKLGDYVVKQRIGAGGMGIVYEGLQPMIGKPVAIKVLRTEFAEDPIQVQRLLAEARAVNAIRHRGIIDIFGFGALPDGRQYIVMEYLSGQPLDAVILERGSLNSIEALPILEEVVAALAAAHGAGVIHRDLKPSNIFIVAQPDGSRYVKLLDFGLAKNTVGSTGNTRVTQVVGTPEYMAPEQARGERLGPWTDLYALGVVAFEILTGQIPFDGTSAIEVAMKHIEQPPPEPSSLDRSIPPELDRLILRMMAKKPDERPVSAEVVRMELKRIQRLLLQAATRVHEVVGATPVAAPTVLAPSPVMRSPILANPVRVFGNGAKQTGYAGGALGDEVDATAIAAPPGLYSNASTTEAPRLATPPPRDTDETRALEPALRNGAGTSQVRAQMRRWSVGQWATLGVFLLLVALGAGLLVRWVRPAVAAQRVFNSSPTAPPPKPSLLVPERDSSEPLRPQADEASPREDSLPAAHGEPKPVATQVAAVHRHSEPQSPHLSAEAAVLRRDPSRPPPAPTREELKQRLKDLERQLHEARPDLEGDAPPYTLLHGWQQKDLRAAKSEKERQDLASKLEDWKRDNLDR